MLILVVNIYHNKTNQIKLMEQVPDDNAVFKSKFDLDKLPSDLSISTMTVTCKIDTEFFPEYIGRYMDLSLTNVFCVKYGNILDPNTNRTLVKLKKKKKKKSFYNQVTMLIQSDHDKYINIKIFSNGSIQMTGCKSVNGIAETLSKLFKKMRVCKKLYDPAMGKIVDKPFVSNPDILHTSNLYNIKICMINSNFNIEFNIDRDELYRLLGDDGYDRSYDPLIHACVNIKYDHPDKIISIFVFETGSIIITGARKCSQIIDAYNFINRYLLNYYCKISRDSSVANNAIYNFIGTTELEELKSIKPKPISDIQDIPDIPDIPDLIESDIFEGLDDLDDFIDFDFDDSPDGPDGLHGLHGLHEHQHGQDDPHLFD